MADTDNSWNPYIDQSLCIGCKQCVDACPTHALKQVNEKASLAHPEKCIYCLVCEDICPQMAIELPFLIINNTNE